MQDFQLPDSVRDELLKRVGPDRANAAIARFTSAAMTWGTLLDLVTIDESNDGSDFFAYVNTLSHREMVETMLAGLTLTKVLASGMNHE